MALIGQAQIGSARIGSGSNNGIIGGFGGSQTITCTGIASGVAFGTPGLRYDQTIFESSLAPGATFGASSLNASSTIATTGIGSASAIGSPVIDGIRLDEITGSITSTAAFGSAVVALRGPDQHIYI